MFAGARDTRVRRDLIERDVDRAELLEVARDASDATGLGEAGVPAERE